MEQTPEQITQQVEQLFEEKAYKEIIGLLSVDLLSKNNNAILFAWRARAHAKLDETELHLIYAQKSIEIDPLLALGYWVRGNAWKEKKEYDKAISDYNVAIRLDPNDAVVYRSRGLAWHKKKEYDKAISDYNEAIRLDPNDAVTYNSRGNTWYSKDKHNDAILDFAEAIRLDPKYVFPHSNMGLTLYSKQEYDKAIPNLNKAIELDQNFSNAYYCRALVLSEKKEYSKAIADYERYIELTDDSSNFLRQVALNRVEELKKKLENAWYDEIDSIVNEIKQLLLFDSPCLTHYTSLSGARALILSESRFRLSEGAFLNDTSEGRELFNYLSFETTKRTTDDTMAEMFVERPFIGSFVADNKHNDLTLWRMYGKEAQAEAKGCALTISRTNFIDNLKKELSLTYVLEDIQSQSEEQFTFYNVAYLAKDKFIIPGKSDLIENQLNNLMNELKSKVEKLSEEQEVSITNLLNSIAYLYKSSEYQYENEVRLVVQGIGFIKKIEIEATPPKVYIELVNIVPALTKITLGPKVERADEWAAAFNYHIKEELKDQKEKVEIIISHLPFK